MSAAELADKAGTAPSAVIRFSRSVGFGGYKEFKLSLAIHLSQANSVSYMPGICAEDSEAVVLDKVISAHIKALTDTLSGIDRNAFSKATNALISARSIYIYGVGTSSGLVGELEHRLMLLGHRVHGYSDVVSMRLSTMNICSGDVVIAISHSGRTMAVVDTVHIASKSGAKTICITSYPFSPVASLCDYVLSVVCDETKYPIEASAARIAQTAIVDSLIAALSVHDFEHAAEKSKAVHDLLDNIRYKDRGRRK